MSLEFLLLLLHCMEYGIWTHGDRDEDRNFLRTAADALVILERAAYHMCHLATAAPAAPGRVLFDV